MSYFAMEEGKGNSKAVQVYYIFEVTGHLFGPLNQGP